MGSSGGGGAGDNNKFQHEPTAREPQLNGSFGDDISDIDADIDLTSPMPVPSVSTRNEVNKNLVKRLKTKYRLSANILTEFQYVYFAHLNTLRLYKCT